MEPKTYIVAKGTICGTYADGFHLVTSSGKIGYYLDRDPEPQERKLILADIVRHREVILKELHNLAMAERALIDNDPANKEE